MFKINEYFDGKVTSIAFDSMNDKATIGVMEAGEYTFETSNVELMTITSGSMQVKQPDSEQWKTYASGETFRVEANVSFNVKMDSDTAYLCVYQD
jgi:purine/pyrimidine-nucleoside phosphorylase